jgi:hypothetical protein
MPRTEKRFGVVNQPSSTAVEELVPSAATTRNLLINATARSAATVSAAIYSGTFSNDATGNVAISEGAKINLSNYTALPSSTGSILPFGKYAGNDVFIGTSSGSSVLFAVDTGLGSAKYIGTANTHTGSNYWRNVLDERISFKTANSGSGDVSSAPIKNPYVAVSSTKAIGINASVATTATASSDMFDSVTYTHVQGVSINESADNVGQVRFQGTGVTGKHGGGAYALQDGVGYLLHFGTEYVYQNTSGRVGLGLYIFSSSSSTFNKRAYWNCDEVTDKIAGYALAYFVASDYNSTSQVFAFSQPSTTTLWSGIGASASTSWPAGYLLPAAAAPAGFRIVSNTGTTNPDENFLTGTITYPAAPTGVTVPTLSSNRPFQVCALKFSPDNTRLAVAYSRNYSGTGNTLSVVVVYTLQGDGSWAHTHSSGSAIRYMPDSPDCMAWSPDGGYLSVSANSSTTSSNITQNVPFDVDRWAIGSGVGSAAIANNTITSWTVASSKYPEFSNYSSPKIGNSTVVSVATATSSLLGATTNNYSLTGSVFANSGSSAGTYFSPISQITATSGPTTALQGIIMQPRGTVGTSGVPATNYVTTVVSDLSLTAGQTTQVSNIVLGSGDRVYVESSTSNSVDISAHGIEST